ncbi:MAG: M43 family zinc metalloprotease [Bacteroidota bacterium]
MKNVIFIFCLFSYFFQYAQSDLHCGTDEIMKKYYSLHPEAEARKKALDVEAGKIKNKSVNSASYTIPVVFHILHLGGPENISDAQVQDAMVILNRDYAKRNADTSLIIQEFKALADSTKIQFVLATRDPSGNCTNGIVHYYDPDTDWDDSSPTIYQYTWDPTRYMNVYIVKTITMSSGFNAAGYTYFPGTFISGSPYDAIVVLNNYFGSTGTGNAYLSRVLTHEAGHWFGLSHVFGNQGTGINCAGDDFVSDTPPTMGFVSCPDVSDPSSYQICTPGQSENFQNYMDYSYCTRMFTHEQTLLMQNTLQSGSSGRNNLWTTSNLISTGVINANTTCVPVADFKYNRSETCVGVAVTFTDASTNAQATFYNWSFPGGTPSTSTLSAPSVTYNTPGVYSVSYSSGTTAGSSGTISKNNIITVITNTANYSASFTEGFESNALPNNDWDLSSSNGSVNWEQSYDASYSGFFCAKLPALNNTRLATTSMISPVVDISAISSPKLNFKLATADVNPAHINTLKVLASTDCESTWTQVYSKTGSSLVTSSSTMNPFIPASLSEWRNEVVSLSAMLGSSHVKFKFMYTRDSISGSSNVFIDDINISGIVGIASLNEETLYDLFPNPANETVTIRFKYTPGLKIDITDVLGQTIGIGDDSIQSGSYTFSVGKQTRFSPGIYFVNIQNDGKTSTKKLIVN